MPQVELGDAEFTPGYVSPERTHEEPSRALFAAWQNCAIDQRDAPADRAFQRDLLSDIVHNACAGEHNMQSREALEQGGEILQYLWFGNDRTPLPRGLRRFLLPSDDSPVLSFNPYEISGQHFGTVLKRLHLAGLDKLVEYRQQLYAEQSPYIFEPLARAIVANTPGYRLLESFNVTQHTWHERPLTYVERLLEERMAEEAVRRRHGMDARQPLMFNPGAQRELGRAIQRIDETTRFDRFETPETRPPMRRARDFFSQVIIDDNAVHGTELRSVTTVRWQYGDIEAESIHIVTDEFEFQTDAQSVVNYTESQGYLNTPSMSRVNAMSTFLVADMITHLFDPEAPERDYAQLLNEFLDRYTSGLVKDLGELAATVKLNPQHFGPLATLLTAPTEADEVLESFWLLVDQLPGLTSPEVIHSRREFKHASRNTLGEIQKRPYHDTDQRILQYRKSTGDLTGFNADEADMVLHLPKLSDSLVPYIPGYLTVSHDPEAKLFGLIYTPEADPYSECHTPIPDAARQTLARQYAELGLHELALLVHGAAELTVSQLTRMVAATNRYALPSTPKPSKIPSKLAGYAEQVADGRLSFQCTGSAHFLRLSLQEVFGPNAAGTIGGDTIPHNGRRLNAAGHEQTVFTDPETGSMYILDATSSSANLAMWREMLSGTVNSLRRQFGLRALKAANQPQVERKAPAAPQERPLGLPQAQRMSEEAAEELRLALIAQTKEALVLQLRMIYGHDGQPMPQETLFTEVAKLPDDDIVFRALSAAVLAPQGRIAKQDVTQLLDYIASLQNCTDPALLRRVDPREYTNQPRLLGALQSHIGQLARLVN